MAKKKNKHRTKKIKPDQVEYFGPFGMARYGKFVVMRNFMNTEQHDEFLRKAAENYLAICQDIDSKVARICALVREFHPLHLLKYGYDCFASKSIGKTAEAELDSSVAIALRMIDYLQSIIVSVPKSETSIESQIDEDKWKELHNEVEQLYYQLNSSFHISRTASLKLNSEHYDDEYDALYVKAQMLWTNVRGHKYSIHDIPHLRRLLSPHDDVFRELFGISIHEFLNGVQKMQESLLCGLPAAYLELKNFQKKTMDIVEERMAEVSTVEGFQELTQRIVKEKGWEKWKDSIMRRIFLFDLFDVQKITGLPERLLNELSWEPGQCLDFVAPREFAGWPLRLLPIQVKPLICVDNKFYCFDLFSLMDNLYRVVQRMITRLKPEYKGIWNNKQKVVSENLPFELFEKLLPGATMHKSIYHLWATGKSGEQNWCETDGIVIYDDHLIVVEIKAGAFTYTPPTTDFPAYMNSIKDLLFKPAMQAKRFIDYLESAAEVPVYDENKQQIATLQRSKFRHITSCCVTIDNFTSLASQAENLKSVGADLDGFPVWSISVDDMQVYADIFESPLVFTHFLEERKRAFESPALKVNDELEHLSLYLKHNRYVTYAADFYEGHPMTWNGYLSDLDAYFHELHISPQTAKKPYQALPNRITEILAIMEKSNNSGRCKASGYLLDMAGETRNTIDESIEEVLTRQSIKKKFIPFTTFGGTNLTVFCCMEGLSRPDISWMTDYVAANLLRDKEDGRMMLILSFNRSNKIVDASYKFMYKADIPANKHDEVRRISEQQCENYLQSYMNDKQVNKIGRNELCPCGSGIKHKRCCGR